MTGLRTMGNGRYKCLYCNHKSYKRMADALTHIENNHALEQAKDTIEEFRKKLDEVKNQPPKVVEKERVVYRDPPAKKEPEYWFIENGGGIYCETCKIVQMRVGIPRGQTIENTPHGQCGNRNLKLVLEVR